MIYRLPQAPGMPWYLDIFGCREAGCWHDIISKASNPMQTAGIILTNQLLPKEGVEDSTRKHIF